VLRAGGAASGSKYPRHQRRMGGPGEKAHHSELRLRHCGYRHQCRSSLILFPMISTDRSRSLRSRCSTYSPWDTPLYRCPRPCPFTADFVSSLHSSSAPSWSSTPLPASYTPSSPAIPLPSRTQRCQSSVTVGPPPCCSPCSAWPVCGAARGYGTSR